jgi:hypothetical protein
MWPGTPEKPHADNPVHQGLNRKKHENALPFMPNSPVRFAKLTIDLIQDGAKPGRSGKQMTLSAAAQETQFRS